MDKIKLIAVDMDGTFLRSGMTYDRQRFRRLYEKMKERNIKFVVASGNQYYQLKSFFDEFQEELTYVAENGAFIVEEGKELFSTSIPREHVFKVVETLEGHENVDVAICGKSSAYILEGDEKFYEIVKPYYHRLQVVKDFNEVEDQFLKLATETIPSEALRIVKELKEAVGTYLEPVHSGHGSVDLIVPGVNKGTGIKLLQERWGITSSEIMAFGDSPNDIEMLKSVKYSYAMENASDAVKEVASYRAMSNNHDGVLAVIEEYLYNNKLP